ncbi:MAG TPA: hypothetical protein VJM31_03415 [Vicinamibacterales bacterium]|nr:hypothetical protein [Vicinamibacterales bacterium]
MTTMLAAASVGWAQGAPAVPPATTVSPAPEAYTYNPDGRRDPFVSLLVKGTETSGGTRSGGLGGLATADVLLRGVLQSRGVYVAIVRGPDGKTYRAQANDRLLDGVIRSVSPQGIVIMQEVNDPLSLVKQREVRKGLRTAEDAK